MEHIIEAYHGEKRRESKKIEFRHIFNTKAWNQPKGILIK